MECNRLQWTGVGSFRCEDDEREDSKFGVALDKGFMFMLIVFCLVFASDSVSVNVIHVLVLLD